ncbi:uncharacterized protein LOC135346153 isoform X3 [Halichondria panicea]|uniref:uncharacterized protein LOC135346153 isoform X3 n=1 Tax=Halichondria panicea TaxID=6063 RepID=UPI00312B96A7
MSASASEKRSLYLQAKQKIGELGVVEFFRSLLALDNVYEGESKLCVQCHSHISPDFDFCSSHCEMKYWDEFNHQYTYHSGETPLCKFPRCFKTCFVENYGRVHDYCSKSHAGEHQKMKEAAERQQHTSRNRRGKGHSWRGGHQLGGRGGARGGGGAGKSQAGRYQQGHTRGGTNYSHCSDSHGTIYFYNRGEPYYEFTNFFPGAAFSLDDSEWPTTEHYFQAQKFVGTPYVHKIRNAFGPRDAFELSRNPAISRWRRSDWEDVKKDVMRKALFAKFTSHPILKKMLLDTGKRELVERSPYDSYWGDGGDGTGENHLGIILMELRAKLQGGQYNDIERDGGMQATQRGTIVSQSSQTFVSTCSGPPARCGIPTSSELERPPLRIHGTSSTKHETTPMDTNDVEKRNNSSNTKDLITFSQDSTLFANSGDAVSIATQTDSDSEKQALDADIMDTN